MPEETEAQEETDETEEPTEEALQIRKMNAFLSPEGIIMMAIALFFDLLDILWFVLDLAFAIGEIPSLISSILAFIVFGFWLLISFGMKMAVQLGPQVLEQKSQRKKSTQIFRMAVRTAGKAAKKGFKTGLKFAIATICEIIPFLGTFFFWTWFVSSVLKDRSKEG